MKYDYLFSTWKWPPGLVFMQRRCDKFLYLFSVWKWPLGLVFMQWRCNTFCYSVSMSAILNWYIFHRHMPTSSCPMYSKKLVSKERIKAKNARHVGTLHLELQSAQQNAKFSYNEQTTFLQHQRLYLTGTIFQPGQVYWNYIKYKIWILTYTIFVEIIGGMI